MYRYHMDSRFYQYFFQKLHQVFFYLTDRCQIRCKHCLYKPNLTFQMGCVEIPVDTVKDLALDFHTLGASKVTLMGGEPALYGDEAHKNLADVICFLRQCGYNYIRLDTNGLFQDDMLANSPFHLLDEVSFSLDGYNEDTNAVLRGSGNFSQTVKNIRRSKELGYKTFITTCVHPKLTAYQDGVSNLVRMIAFADSLGVEEINFHVLLKHGFPMDTWTEDTAISASEWLAVRDDLLKWLPSFHTDHSIRVRVPQHFVKRSEFEANPQYYGYCPVKLGERLLIHPDGQLRICSGLISSKYCIAKFLPQEKKILWEEGYTNEATDHSALCNTPCTNQSKGMRCGEDIVPLCFSFKPLQQEYVWKNKLQWDKDP